ncbi:hypothetical protein [uncultured Stenotrophomonas sp.]|uniref:hypothetical protein n=1 Tax=uncultured Stenotrophomonas sp. TaxID=165438 RepID=UPI0025EB93DA|nr:hypothetical protein [uncultured Stenotrophomonas sp.]
MSSLPIAVESGRRAALVMLVSVLLCYGLAAMGLMGWPAWIAFAGVLLGVLLALPAVRDLRTAPLLLVVIALVLIALGSPSDGWDPRSIWLFHAKRMYLEGSLYAQLDDYAPWSHNDYPALGPLMMAAAAGLAGHWNELLPKAAAPLLLLPALLLIAPSFRGRWSAALFALLLLRLGREMLGNGYMDALVAVYAVAAVATAMRWRTRGNQQSTSELVAFTLLLAVLSILKNEGGVLAALLAATVLIEGLLRERGLHWHILVATVLALLPLLAWKLTVAHAGVGNDLAGSDMAAQLLARLGRADEAMLIVKRLLLDTWVWLPLLALAVLWRPMLRAPAASAAVLAALAYAALLLLVYMATPHDLDWHLRTSVERVRMPVSLLLVFAVLVALEQRMAAGSARSG